MLDRSRRLNNHPKRTLRSIEQLIVTIRLEEPHWGAKKIKKLLSRNYSLIEDKIPSVTTIHHIIKRNGLEDPADSIENKPITRFEYKYPNDLWQMDFKGDFLLKTIGRRDPLTITDDHSRWNLCLQGLAHQRYELVKDSLVGVFRR